MRKPLAAAAASMVAWVSMAQTPADPVTVVQRQVEAYNAHDLDAFVATYAEDVELWQLGPEPRLTAKGRQALQRDYASFFAARRPHAEITQRQVMGPYVIDSERVSTSDGRYLEAAATYLVEDGLIRRVWFAAAPPRAGASDKPLALLGATLIDGTGGPAVADSILVVRNGRVACAGARKSCSIPEGAERVDLTGRFITPGLVDAHIHTGQTGWLDGRPDGLARNTIYPYAQVIAELRADSGRWHRAHLCSGVTAAFDVGGQPWTVAAAKQAQGRPDRLNIRAAGPLVTPAPRPVMNLPGEPTFLPLASEEDGRAAVAGAKASGADAVKLWFLAPAPDQRDAVDARVRTLGAAARAAKLPFIVHATELREAKVALRAGATMLVHSVSDGPVDDEFLRLLVRGRVAYAPTLVVGANWRRAVAAVYFGAAPEIDDPNNCVDAALRARIGEAARLRADMSERVTAERLFAGIEAAGAEREIAAANLRRVRDAGGLILLATDAGNPLTLHGPSVHEELEAMEASGLSPEQLIPIATRNGASAMGDLARFGTVEAGKQADLLVLAQDPRRSAKAFRSLTHVVRGGIMRAQAELRAR